MKVSIHQPSYFPWLGLLNKIDQSELYVLLDTVQLSDSAYQNRNLFLDNQGKKHLLTLPIKRKSYTNKPIKDIHLSNYFWQKKHQKFIFFNYKKYPFFDEIYPSLETIYTKKYTFLVDVLIDTMELSLSLFKINTRLVKSSILENNKDLNKEEMVLDILRQTKATTYLSGIGARSYQNNENFTKAVLNLEYQSFKHPVYPFFKDIDFIEGLSCLDLLFNVGIDKALQYLRGEL